MQTIFFIHRVCKPIYFVFLGPANNIFSKPLPLPRKVLGPVAGTSTLLLLIIAGTYFRENVTGKFCDLAKKLR